LHYVVTLAVLIWLWRAHPNAYLPARRTLTAATLLGLVGFATVPVTPARMLPASSTRWTATEKRRLVGGRSGPRYAPHSALPPPAP
jgi:hypothetical protein